MISNTLEPEKFEMLMNWLDSDKEAAGLKYESIRNRLIKIFYARGCYRAEELADETMDRVTRKVDTLFGIYEGDPALYFYAVARNVLHEFSRVPHFAELPENISQTIENEDEDDDALRCLDECLQKINENHRNFILEYYTGHKREKIDRRKRMAEETNVSDKALRIRAYRIRDVLRKCIATCLGETGVA